MKAVIRIFELCDDRVPDTIQDAQGNHPVSRLPKEGPRRSADGGCVLNPDDHLRLAFITDAKGYSGGLRN